MRYVVDEETGKIHDRRMAVEKCNLDDLAPGHRREIDKQELIKLITPWYDSSAMGYEEPFYTLCDHCFGDD